ncbi:unnamed protein product [Linum tenue]|nr:unnamed protein product [Linum tenue]
MLRSVA